MNEIGTNEKICILYCTMFLKLRSIIRSGVQYILECKILLEANKKNGKETKELEFNKLFIGTVKEQLEISKLFGDNMQILETF